MGVANDTKKNPVFEDFWTGYWSYSVGSWVKCPSTYGMGSDAAWEEEVAGTAALLCGTHTQSSRGATRWVGIGDVSVPLCLFGGSTCPGVGHEWSHGFFPDSFSHSACWVQDPLCTVCAHLGAELGLELRSVSRLSECPCGWGSSNNFGIPYLSCQKQAAECGTVEWAFSCSC
jgi:hypothetical protein